MNHEAASIVVPLERSSREPRVGWIVVALLGVVSVALAPLMVGYLAWQASGLIPHGSLGRLLDARWSPGSGSFGLLPLVLGTLASSTLAMLVALPLGIGTAIAVCFYAGSRARRLGDTALGILGGTPSVVFGLFGTVWLVPTLGANLLTAGLVLAAMITPTLALLAAAAFDELPPGLFQSGLSLGVPRGRVVRGLALRAARPALIAAASFALARALGEALAVEMVCGNVPNLPTGLTTPIRTLTTTLVQEFEYAHGAHGASLNAAALAVVALAGVASGVAVRLASRRTLPEVEA